MRYFLHLLHFYAEIIVLNTVVLHKLVKVIMHAVHYLA